MKSSMSFFIAAALCCLSWSARAAQNCPGSPEGPVLRVGIFWGGRTDVPMRAYEAWDYEKEGVQTEFWSKNLREDGYHVVPRSLGRYERTENPARITGTELIDRMLEGRWDLAMVGESSFLAAAAAGKPIVAVAELGHDVKGQAGHVFAVQNGVKVSDPGSYRGLLLISRRAGPGDSVFLREFLSKEGVDLERDVRVLAKLPGSPQEKAALPKDKIMIVDQVFEDDLDAGIDNGVIDGGYMHLQSMLRHKGKLRVVKPLHAWADPEMSMALLVSTKKFLHDEANRRKLTVFLAGYMRRIRYEKALGKEERMKVRAGGRQMETDLGDLNFPQFEEVPLVKEEVLAGMLRLLRKYGEAKPGAWRLKDFIDNAFVRAAAERIASGAGEVRGVVVIGWDGAGREKVNRLLGQGKLPHLAALVRRGGMAGLEIREGATCTKPGWAQILTGRHPAQTGVLSNREYRPIPRGLTLFEVLKDRLGQELVTVLLAGKYQNLGRRGPHRICPDCPDEGPDATWWDETRAQQRPGKKLRLREMPGEPYLWSQAAIDLYENDLGAAGKVGERVLHHLGKLKGKRFFLFAEFEEPDRQGHVSGEGSRAYLEAIENNDRWLGRIMVRIQELGLGSTTVVHVASDHGFDGGLKSHYDAAETFFASSCPLSRTTGDIADAAPTALVRFGIDPATVIPPLDGRSLTYQ